MRLLALVALLPVVVACGPSRPPAFVDEAADVAELELYEGVPRDPSRARAEPTITIDGETYYKTPTMVRDDDAHRLGRAMRSPEHYKSHVEGKKCGGFHADYGVVWRGTAGKQRVHFCFGCGELRSESSQSSSLVDIDESGRASLESILASALAAKEK